MAAWKNWLEAFRLRTLPLAMASILMGNFLAYADGRFRIPVLLLCLTTTILLQVLSNLGNDYGDTQHGADSSERVGPARSVQSGKISRAAMRTAILLNTVLCLFSGILLIYVALGWNVEALAFFFTLGLLSIVAALTYTMGKRPYGYAGLGDISVFIFFGIVGVAGSYYLQVASISPDILLPAGSCGLFSVGVLNLNNIRDIDSDRKAGKYSIPVRLGHRRAVVYHWILLLSGMGCAVLYGLINFRVPFQWLFLLSLPLFLRNGIILQKTLESRNIDPLLKQLALSTLLFVLLFGTSSILPL